MKCKAFLLLIIMVILAAQQTVNAKPLDCSYGSSNRWSSGWCDLRSPINLAEGACISLLVGGTAENILVRALRNGDDPNDTIGLLGDKVSVPKERNVVVKLQKTYSNVIQISVHGGRKAWHISLGNQNGPATLKMAEHVNCPATN